MSLRLRSILLVLAAIFTVGFSVSALAQQGDPSTAAGDQARPAYHQVFLDKLAGVLGIDRTKLDDAMRQAQNGVVDKMLTDGVVTEQEAGRIRDQIASGKGPLGGPFGGPGHWGGRHMGPMGFMGQKGGHLDAAAGALGMTSAEVRQALQDGKTLGQLADEKGVDRQKVKDAILAQHKEALDKAVAAGRITQTEADKILEKASAEDLLDGKFGCRAGHGGRGMRGMSSNDSM